MVYFNTHLYQQALPAVNLMTPGLHVLLSHASSQGSQVLYGLRHFSENPDS